MNKNLLYALLFLGLGGYYAYDTFYPEYVAWETEIEELQKNLEQARTTAPRLADLKKEEEELQERLSASLEKLPSGAELDNLLAMVTPILEGVGIQSTQIGQKNVDPASELDIYRIHPIRITDIKGVSMRQVTKLLFDLRNFYRIINVRNFTMTRTAADEYVLNLDLETYSYIAAEGEEVPAPRTPPPAPTAPADSVPAPPAPPTDTGAAADAPAGTDTAAPGTSRSDASAPPPTVGQNQAALSAGIY